ncbi:type IV secretion system DNA-binding domain-containing protein [Orientia tsutsugamushi]|uniref:type IV secretion system DNA-binding domain-containing protein n=1 Tax=Orientia tsutsugamushi TaxID=784 RepID=UPI00315D6A27
MNFQNQGNFTRGSQLFAHKLRMFGQGSTNVFMIGLGLSIFWIICRLYQKVFLSSLYYFAIERYVQLKLAIGEHFYDIDQIGIKFYSLRFKKWMHLNAQDFLHEFYTGQHGFKIQQLWEFLINSSLLEGLIVFAIGVIISIVFFTAQGKNTIIKAKIRGADFVECKCLSKMLKSAKKASKICFGGLPLVKNSERLHILITGTTGTGKTNMLNELLPQIRLHKDRAIIVDTTGAFTDRFFDHKCDRLLNPFEKNSEQWLPWNDCFEAADFHDIASSFSNYTPKLDDFFAKNAELVLSEALKLYKDDKDIIKLIHTIIYSDNRQFAKAFRNTAVSGIISESALETSAGIQSTLGKNITSLQYLKPGGSFSIKEWFSNSDETSWLFITANPNQRATLCPLISAWISIAIKALMCRNPNHDNKNMWFILDELPALQKVSSLPVALAESRKYGGCFVAGLQNIHQLEAIYGAAECASMLDLFNSKFIFRVSDQVTAYKSALTLGEQEIIETQENLSYGSNTMRDGVNMNNVERKKILVMPSEIMNLPDLTCYVKLAGNFPITKLTMQLQNLNTAFVWGYKLLKKLKLVEY